MSSAQIKQHAYSFAESSGAANLLQSLGHFDGSQVYVLAYHRVDLPEHRPWLNPELINASPAQFYEQMALLKCCYQPVSIADVLEASNGGKKLPRHAVLVTVDDGYRDFQETILPVCRKFGIRPLLFVPTAYVGQGIFWWDKLYEIIHFSGWKFIATAGNEKLSISTLSEKQAAMQYLSQAIKQSNMEKDSGWLDERYREYLDNGRTGILNNSRNTLDWDELRTVTRQGADVAAHTHSHPILSRIPEEQIRYEIRQSKEIIQSQLGYDLPVFAYPDGLAADITPETRRITREEGIQLAFTMQAKRTDLEHDSHDYLPRLGTWSKLNLGHFHLRLTPLFSLIQTLSVRDAAA